MEKNATFSTALSRQLDRNALSSLSSTSMNRVDPVFAAAAAAAVMNAGLLPPNSTDFGSGSLSAGSGGNSQAAAVAAVAAAAMNAAAMAAALGVGNMSMNNRSLTQATRQFGTSQPSGPRNSLTSSSRSSRTSSSSRYPNAMGNNTNSHSGSAGRSRIGQGQHRREKDLSHAYSARFPHHLDHRDPEDDPSATRTLFVGNLMPEITEADLRSLFERYGFIEDIDIKRREPDSGMNAYAFIRFVNLDMAHRAKVDMSGELIGQFTCKIGYGKVVPTRCLWIGGLGPWITYPAFATLLDEFGPPEKIIWPSGKNYANVLFPTVELATIAANALRGYPLGGDNHRIRVDFTDESHIISDPLLSRRRPAAPSTSVDYPNRKGFYGARTHRESSYPDDGSSFAGQTVRRLKRDHKLSESDSGHSRNPNRSPPGKADAARKSHRSVRDQPTPKRKCRGTPSDSEMTDIPDTPVASKVPNLPKPNTKDNALPTNVLSGPQNAVNVEQLASCLPTAWDGAFFLKSSCFPCRMHILRGDQSLVDQFMSCRTELADTTSRSSRGKLEKEDSTRKPKSHQQDGELEQVGCLRITQRMKLDPMKLEDVSQRIQAAGNSGFCVLLAVPSPTTVSTGSYSGQTTDSSDLIKQPQRPLRNLIAYLRTKDSAGVVLLNPLNQNQSSGSDSLPVTGVLHAFPPCDFAFDLLRERAVHLQKEYTKDDHLVILLIRSTGGL